MSSDPTHRHCSHHYAFMTPHHTTCESCRHTMVFYACTLHSNACGRSSRRPSCPRHRTPWPTLGVSGHGVGGRVGRQGARVGYRGEGRGGGSEEGVMAMECMLLCGIRRGTDTERCTLRQPASHPRAHGCVGCHASPCMHHDPPMRNASPTPCCAMQ